MKDKSALSLILMAGGMMGGGFPTIRTPQSNTEVNNLPEGFKVWMFDRNTRALIDLEWREKNDIERVNIFKVVSRSEENARKEFKRLTNPPHPPPLSPTPKKS